MKKEKKHSKPKDMGKNEPGNKYEGLILLSDKVIARIGDTVGSKK